MRNRPCLPYQSSKIKDQLSNLSTEKGATRSKRMLKIIVQKFGKVELNDLPVFAASDLKMLPQPEIGHTYVDVISQIQDDISSIKSSNSSWQKSDDRLERKYHELNDRLSSLENNAQTSSH